MEYKRLPVAKASEQTQNTVFQSQNKPICPNLQRLKNITAYQCPECKSRRIEYIGLGKYQCKKCGHEMLDNYGKVRECIDMYGPVTMQEVMDITGLSREDIRELSESGSITIVGTGIQYW